MSHEDTLDTHRREEVSALRRRVAALEAGEQQKREAEERFRLISTASSDAIYDWDLRTGVIWRSQGYQRLLHHPTAQERRKGWWEAHLHPDDREATLLGVQTTLASSAQTWRAEYRFHRDDGAELWLADQASIVRDEQGAPIRLVGAMTDITARKRVEAQLARSTERLRILRDIGFAILMAQSPEAIARAALPRVRQLIPSCLRATVALFDWRQEASHLLAADGVNLPAAGHQPFTAFPQRAQNIEAFRRGEIVHIPDLQSVAHQSLVLQTYVNIGARSYIQAPLLANGQLIGSLNLAASQPQAFSEEDQDIIREVAASLAVALAQAQLHVQLQQQATDVERQNLRLQEEIEERRRAEEALRHAKDLAESANLAKSQFLANMSHEIRTPMNGVLGMTELLLSSSLTTKQRRFAELAHHSGQSLLKLLNGILDFAKIEAGKIELEEMDFSPRSLVADISELLRQPAEHKGLTLEWNVSDNTAASLRGDAYRLHQVLMNLLSNAIKFTEQGIITINVQPAVETTTPPPQTPSSVQRLAFSVQDTGIGISPKIRQRLFQPFTQADGSTTRKYGGTGLGLAITKQLIELMGGDIRVESTPGRGSIFTFTVPFTVAQPLLLSTTIDQPQEHLQSASREQPLRVLVAEDNAVNQDVARAMLDSLGHRATVVDNGRLALQAITTGSYDVILMDCHMPEMDGFTATRAIRLWERAQSHRASLPIIALTANVTEDNRERCLAVGMNDFLEKPFTQEQLHLLLWRLLGKTTTTPPSLLPATQPTEPAGPTRQTTVHLDPKALANIRVLQRPGAPNVLDKIIQVYLTTTPSLLAQLRDAIAQEDAELVERSAHTLKSSSASLGANELAALSKELELLGRARTFTQAARLMTAIEELYPAVSAALLVEQGKHHF